MEEKKIKVLIIDDEVDFSEAVAFWLQSKGHDVRTASNGKDAIQIVKKYTPDIIFCDINLPIMDGIEILGNIRRINKNIPVVMITAYADETKMAKAEKLGASGFFPKKGNLEELGVMLQATLMTHKKLQTDKT